MLYTLLKVLLTRAAQVFFRHLDVEGAEHVPTRGPLLLAANHPNTLIDVLLVASAIERKVGFVAKSTLFKGFTGWLFRHMGAVPVARRDDGPVTPEAQRHNAEVLERCERTIAGGQAILIFPEGVSQDDPRLMRLKTGLARIALGAAERTDEPVTIVPAALTYDHPGTFRSRARVRFGSPLDVTPYLTLQRELEAKGEDAFQATRSLTEAVRQGLLEGAVHVEEVEHAPLLHKLDVLYGAKLEADAGGRLAATAALARALNDFAEREPERVVEIEQEVDAYRQRLQDCEVEDYALRVHHSRPRPGAVEDLAFVFGAPFAWWGILNHFIYYQIPELLVRGLAADRLYASTIKLLGGLLALGLCYALQTWAVWTWTNQTVALIYLGTLPLSGMIALLWLEGFYARRRVRTAQQALRRLPAEQVSELAGRRRSLVRKLDQARAVYLARVLEGTPEREEPW